MACDCGQLLDVAYDWQRHQPPGDLRWFEGKWSRRHEPLAFSGVWRFRELLPFAPPEMLVTIGEGQTLLQRAPAVGKYVGLVGGQLHLQYEGLNPSGSFKDNGMTSSVGCRSESLFIADDRYCPCSGTPSGRAIYMPQNRPPR